MSHSCVCHSSPCDSGAASFPRCLDLSRHVVRPEAQAKALWARQLIPARFNQSHHQHPCCEQCYVPSTTSETEPGAIIQCQSSSPIGTLCRGIRDDGYIPTTDPEATRNEVRVRGGVSS